jgi:hypothetical protein
MLVIADWEAVKHIRGSRGPVTKERLPTSGLASDRDVDPEVLSVSGNCGLD